MALVPGDRVVPLEPMLGTWASAAVLKASSLYRIPAALPTFPASSLTIKYTALSFCCFDALHASSPPCLPFACRPHPLAVISRSPCLHPFSPFRTPPPPPPPPPLRAPSGRFLISVLRVRPHTVTSASPSPQPLPGRPHSSAATSQSWFPSSYPPRSIPRAPLTHL